MERRRQQSFTHLALAFWLVAVASQTVAQGNLVGNPGFESAEAPDWRACGHATSAKLVADAPRAGRSCLYVFDNGDQGGQADNARFAARPGLYYVEGWLRVDAERPSLALLDVQYFDEQARCMGSDPVGQTTATEWARCAAFVSVPDAARTVRLRVQPAWGGGKLTGACFVDDLYMAPLDDAKQAGRLTLRYELGPCANIDLGGKVGVSPPDITGKPMAHKSQIDFEDLSGWRVEVLGNLNGTFCRSREEQLAGRYVGKVTFTTDGGVAHLALRPPKPIPVRGSFDAVQIWGYSDRRIKPPLAAPQVTVVVTQSGRRRAITLPRIAWSFWSIAHHRLAQPVSPEAAIVELRIENLRAPKDRPLTICVDELAFHNDPIEPLTLDAARPACPTRPETILPTTSRAGRNEVRRDGAAFCLSWQGGAQRVVYRYTPQRGTLDDVTVSVDGGRIFRPAAAGGPVLSLRGRECSPLNGSAAGKPISVESKGDAVTALWRYSAEQGQVTLTWRMRIQGKSLVLTVDEPTGSVTRWQLGKPDAVAVAAITVPYLTHHCESEPVWLVDRRAFVHIQPDYYVTNASVFAQGNCEYVPLLNGRRNPLQERIFLTVSTDFEGVLPNIPNPRSPTAHVIGSHVYTNLSGSLHDDALDRCLALWRQMKGLGMDRIIVKHHAHTWSDHSGQGNEPFVQRVKAARNIPGGDAALTDYIEQVKALGYQYFLYTDYCIIAPVCEHFDEGMVSLDTAGQWKPGWYQYYALTPLMAPKLAARFAPQIKAKYGLTGSYCDQHTSPPPSRWVDYDPRKPGAGMLRTAFNAYCRVFEIEKEAYGGPVVSEGGNYWFYAGEVDGNYAQLRSPKGAQRWQMPFLVDFDLLKIHPLEVDIGMGWRGSYGYDKHAKNWDDALDRFLCATVAFGHSGILYGPNFPGVYNLDPADPLGRWKRSVVRTYFMIQQLAERYALVPVRQIRYWDGTQMLATSDAIRSGAYKRSQVAVEYENGLRVFANGSFDETWRIELSYDVYELPPNGWLATQGDEFLEYSALRGGHRVDYVRSPLYTFADGRGVATDFGDIRAKEAVIALHRRNGERHELATRMGP